jgi:hypothetical protein
VVETDASAGIDASIEHHQTDRGSYSAIPIFFCLSLGCKPYDRYFLEFKKHPHFERSPSLTMAEAGGVQDGAVLFPSLLQDMELIHV